MQNLRQISLPIRIDETKTILHAPIVEEYFDEAVRQVLDALEPLRQKTFRRYHTIENALRRQLGESQALRWKFCVMGAARQHTTNGIIMAANRADISWRMVRVFRANRSLERALKKHKLSFRHICPACQGSDMPF